MWKLFLKHYKLFPNLEICTFSGFEAVEQDYLYSDDLFHFPKLKKIKLEDTIFYEEKTISLFNKHWGEDDEEYAPLKCMDKLSDLKYLEEIDFLLLEDINNLKKFKSLKKITKFACLEPEENVESLAPFIVITVGIGFVYLLFKEGTKLYVQQQDDYIHEKRMERKKEEDRKREVDNLKDEIEKLKKQKDKKI